MFRYLLAWKNLGPGYCLHHFIVARLIKMSSLADWSRSVMNSVLYIACCRCMLHWVEAVCLYRVPWQSRLRPTHHCKSFLCAPMEHQLHVTVCWLCHRSFLLGIPSDRLPRAQARSCPSDHACCTSHHGTAITNHTKMVLMSKNHSRDQPKDLYLLSLRQLRTSSEIDGHIEASLPAQIGKMWNLIWCWWFFLYRVWDVLGL